MKLTICHFFEHLIFEPNRANERWEKGLAWASTLILGVLTVGLCQLSCYIWRVCKVKQPEELNDADHVTSKIGNSVLSPTTSNPPLPSPPTSTQWPTSTLKALKQPSSSLSADSPQHRGSARQIAQSSSPISSSLPNIPTPPYQEAIDPIRQVPAEGSYTKQKVPFKTEPFIQQLFAKSVKYRLETLPSIQDLYQDFPNRQTLNRYNAPVSYGMLEDGTEYLAIKVNCTLSDDSIKQSRFYSAVQEHVLRKLEDLLIIYFHDDFNRWKQEPEQAEYIGFTPFWPSFLPNQDDLSQKVQTLLKDGKVTDRHGLVWTIPNH